MPETADIRLAAYAYSVRDGSLLLAQIAPGEDDAGHWTLPGGGLDWGEHPEDGLARELWEETGLRGTIEDLLGIESIVFPAERRPGLPALHSLRIVYRVDCSGVPRVTEKDGSVDDTRWIPLDDLSSIPTVDLVDFALQKSGAH
ncbi:MAG: NUDIX hydrolase [Acidimicrobiia bacterium]